MSKHLKADGTQTQNGDIPVVTPSNIGKGLKYDASTNKYNVNVGTGTGLEIKSDGTVGIALSKVTDNLLQGREDGLYYGTQAPANTQNLYVDAVNGVDQDPNIVKDAGTRAKPLRTIYYANKLAQEGTNRNIYLHEKQDHILDASNGSISIKQGNLVIRLYGETSEEAFKSNPEYGNNYSYNKWAVEQGYAARIVLRGVAPRKYPNNANYETSSSAFINPYLSVMHVPANTNLKFLGVVLVQDLGFEFDASGTKDQERSVIFVNPNRITVEGFVNCTVTGFQTIGTPIITNLTPKAKEYMSANMAEPHSSGLYEAGFFNLKQGSFYFQNVSTDRYPLSEVKAFIFGSEGWGTKPTSNAQVSLAYSGDAAELAKRIKNVIKDTTNILAPQVDVPYRYFE